MLRATVVTNIRTPNNDALFAEVARQGRIELQVVYAAANEANRDWRLRATAAYPHRVLSGWTLGGSTHINLAIGRVLRALVPDVVVLGGSYTMPTTQLAGATLARRGTPWVYWGEEVSHAPTSAPARALRTALRWPVRRAAGVLAVGSRARASYVRAGVPPDRVAEFHYYADAGHFALAPAERAAARRRVRERHGIADDALVAVYAGQLIPRKDVAMALRALGRLACADRDPGWVLLIAGDGPQRAALGRLAGELGIQGRVQFAGFVQPAALPEYFAAGDCCVLPSRREGWGVVVGEALAAGLPVFASTRVNAAADLVREGENGGVFAPGDDAALAALLGNAARPGRLPAMAAQARAAVADETPSVAAARLARLLGAVRDGHSIGAL